MGNYQSPLLSAYGVFEAEGADSGVAAHYGNPLREQRALARGGERFVAVDFSQLGVVSVSGADRLSWMTTLSSQVLENLEPGQSRELLLLSAQGRIEFAPLTTDIDGTLWLVVEGDQAQDLTDYLNRMKFMLRVEVSNQSAHKAVVGSVADPRVINSAPEILKNALVIADPWHTPGVGGTSYAAVEPRLHPGSDYRWFYSVIDRKDLSELGSKVELAGAWAAEALRIEAWRPRYGTEVDARSIPHELDYLRSAVHMNKGCYKGQETVARVHNLGHPPRRLVFLDLDGSEHTLPAHGAGVYLGEKKVGTLTSVAQHFEAGPIALAVLKRNVPLDAELRVKDGGQLLEDGSASPISEYSAAQTEIVSPDAGQVAGRRNTRDFFRG